MLAGEVEKVGEISKAGIRAQRVANCHHLKSWMSAGLCASYLASADRRSKNGLEVYSVHLAVAERHLALLKGFKTGFPRNALLCACNVKDGLSNDSENNGAI